MLEKRARTGARQTKEIYNINEVSVSLSGLVPSKRLTVSCAGF